MTAAFAGLICVAASGIILVTLHFLPTGLDPIRYAVSDYGWTSYQLGYRTMVVLQGAGRSSSQSGWGNRPMRSPSAGSTSTASSASSSQGS